MELKPSKGLRVKVNASREALFGDESVSVGKVKLPDDGSRLGVMTGATLAGFCEVEMPALDGKKHWYPVDSLAGEHGEAIVEDIPPIDVDDDAEDDTEE